MSQNRTALIETSANSSWGSCLTIMPNLISAYRESEGHDMPTFHYGKNHNSIQVLECAKKIFDDRPRRLVFIDHEKHPHDLLLAMHVLKPKTAWPDLVFHLYGDFTLFTSQWLKTRALLRGRRALFVCASPRQRLLVSDLLVGGSARTAVCPFPVAENEFSFQSGLREETRSALGISKDEFVLIYTGRLSAQKNVLRLISDAVVRCEALGLPYRILIAGAFDDLGAPFFGLHIGTNSYYEGFNKLIASLPEKTRARIHYVGQKTKPELKALYHSADLFVSLSTHHDEDYGMSPIEALCCGTPAVISDWGGFHGFDLRDGSVALLPVSLSSTGPAIDVGPMLPALIKYHHQSETETDADRAARSKRYLDSFGIHASAKLITAFRAERPPVFAGFTQRLGLHANLLDQSKNTGYMFAPGTKIDPNYKTFYRHYCNEDYR